MCEESLLAAQFAEPVGEGTGYMLAAQFAGPLGERTEYMEVSQEAGDVPIPCTSGARDLGGDEWGKNGRPALVSPLRCIN